MTETTSASTAVTIPQADQLVDLFNYKFNFRSVVNELGEKTKRTSLTLQIPAPSAEGILEIVAKGGKGLTLLKGVVQMFVAQQAKLQVDENPAITQETLDLSKLDWEYIANQSASETRGASIAKETWEAFAADYLEVMVPQTGKPKANIENHTKIFLGKLASVKTNKPVLTALVGALGTYVSVAPNAESFGDILELLQERAEKYLNLKDEDLLANI